MKNSFRILFFIAFLGLSFSPVAALETPAISTKPESPLQGEPLMISVQNSTLDQVAKIYWNNRSLWFFSYQNQPTAFIGIDLNAPAGEQKIKVQLENGQILAKTITVRAREKILAPLGIPEKLGGDTPTAQTKLVTNLTKENVVINKVFSANRRFWFDSFGHPVATPQITDTYGYLRQTGYYSIPHKGADFKATTGTEVLAINRGVVRLAQNFTVYGNTVAIDHGLGVVSYYMHLSKIKVKVGDLVARGGIIGASGETGYALSPHLHLSIKINNISIDPAKFLELFKTQS